VTSQARHARPRRLRLRHRLRRAAAVAALATLLAILLGAGSCSETPTASPQASGQQQTEQAFKDAAAAIPYPANEFKNGTLERANLLRLLRAENKPDALGYVYLQSFGKVLGYYTIKGKVSSNQSQMTTTELVEHHADSGGGNLTYPAPGDNLTYGENEPGIFFFTTEGTLVKTNLDYVYATQPLPFNVPQLNK